MLQLNILRMKSFLSSKQKELFYETTFIYLYGCHTDPKSLPVSFSMRAVCVRMCMCWGGGGRGEDWKLTNALVACNAAHVLKARPY